MSALSIFYLVLGAALIALGISCVAEKYRTVHGGALCTARILRCDKQGPATRKSAGGYRYTVEFTWEGIVYNRPTNDSFWFDHSSRVGELVQVWYNPARPDAVERRSFEAEVLGALSILAGLALFAFLGLG